MSRQSIKELEKSLKEVKQIGGEERQAVEREEEER